MGTRACLSTSTTQNVSQPNQDLFVIEHILTSLSAGDCVVNNIYGENLERLQVVKAKYDPKNVFHKMQPIPTSASVGQKA